MKSHEFYLRWKLPADAQDPEQWVDVLCEAGCDDALIGLGQKGSLGLDFDRDAETLETAINSAISDVGKAIPGATLIEVGPDQIVLSDIARLFGISRQACHKLISDPKKDFPLPMHAGKSALWHMCDVLLWAAQNRQPIQPEDPEGLLAVSEYALKYNQRRQAEQAELYLAASREMSKRKEPFFVKKDKGVRRKRHVKEVV